MWSNASSGSGLGAVVLEAPSTTKTFRAPAPGSRAVRRVPEAGVHPVKGRIAALRDEIAWHRTGIQPPAQVVQGPIFEHHYDDMINMGQIFSLDSSPFS